MNTSKLEHINETTADNRCIETPSQDIRENFLYVQEVGFLKSLKPCISHREKMDSYLIVFVLSGEGYFTYQDVRTKVYTGACFFIDCRQSYSHECAENSQWELVWVHFNGNYASGYYKYFIKRSENIFYPLNYIEIADNLYLIHDNVMEKPRYYELTNNLLLTKLLTEIITCLKQQKKHSYNQITTEQKLEEIHSYLQRNYMNSCSLDDLSEKFYVSKYYLSREFKQRFGEGISAYLAKLRVSRAKELLRFSDKSTGEIAAICGVNDSNHFLKVFKKIEGITPTEYRKKWRE